MGAGEDTGGGAAPSVTVAPDGSPGPSSGALLAGSGLAVLALAYLGVYVLQLGNRHRYHDGFILTRCPACGQGTLSLDERRYRTAGLPRVRRVARCDNCRSVLRQTRPGVWRYTVDSAANPGLAAQYDGRPISDRELIEIAPESHGAAPRYIEDDTG